MSTCLNCGTATCLCPVLGTNLVEIGGTGSEADPFVFHVECADIVACVGAMMTDVGFTTGMLATGAEGEHLQADEQPTAVWAGVAEFCIPDVMGSELWEPSDAGPTYLFEYDSGGEFYYGNILGNATQAWPDAFSGDQSIEVTFSNFGTSFDPDPPLADIHSIHDYIAIACRRGGNLHLGDGLWIYFNRYTDTAQGGFDPDSWKWWIDYEVANVTIHYDESAWMAWPYGEEFRLRLESDTTGDYRVYVDDVLLTSGTVVGQPSGPSKFGIHYEGFGTSGATKTPHFADLCLHGED